MLPNSCWWRVNRPHCPSDYTYIPSININLQTTYFPVYSFILNQSDTQTVPVWSFDFWFLDFSNFDFWSLIFESRQHADCTWMILAPFSLPACQSNLSQYKQIQTDQREFARFANLNMSRRSNQVSILGSLVRIMLALSMQEAWLLTRRWWWWWWYWWWLWGTRFQWWWWWL